MVEFQNIAVDLELVSTNLEDSLEIMQKEYMNYKESLKKYPFNSDLMCEQFLEVFEKIHIQNKN